jgi:hypothetical protein
VIVEETVAPFVGDVTPTETPVVVIVSETGRVLGDPAAFASWIVAVAVWIPSDCPAGFTVKRTEVEAFEPREPETGAKVSQAWVEDADQLSVVNVGPVFWMTMPWLEVAVAPWEAAKESGVEVVTERTARFFTVAVEVAVDVLFDVSVESAQRVVEPFGALPVFQDTEYKVPLGVEVEPMRVDDASVEPNVPS